MPISNDQRSRLAAAAQERGLDPAKLIAEAERQAAGQPDAPGDKPKGDAPTSAEKPKLFMYLLPFVTVREVRQNWLELTDSFPGDNMPAAEWAAKFASVPDPTKSDPNAQ